MPLCVYVYCGVVLCVIQQLFLGPSKAVSVAIKCLCVICSVCLPMTIVQANDSTRYVLRASAPSIQVFLVHLSSETLFLAVIMAFDLIVVVGCTMTHSPSSIFSLARDVDHFFLPFSFSSSFCLSLSLSLSYFLKFVCVSVYFLSVEKND